MFDPIVYASSVSDPTVEGFGPGAVFAERFEIEALVGAGATGLVFRGRDRSDGALVAIKLLRSVNEEDRERFTREARALSTLSHATIVSLVGSGLAPSGQPFIAMRWIAGETLAERVGRGPLSERETLSIARSLLSALDVAHSAGVLHRDVKPANVVLEDDLVDRAVLVDFGLVRSKHDPVRSRAGVPLGTPAYMAPEQVRGEAEIDARADLFSLGCLLFECLSGRRAFDGSDVIEVFAAVLLDAPPSLRELAPNASPSLIALIERLLDKDPNARPSSAREALFALDELLAATDRAAKAPLERHSVSVEQRVLACASLAWALFADTDRWDRHCRAPRTQYASHDGPDGERLRVGSAVLAEQPSRWIEAGEGVAGVSLRASRRFIDGAFAEIGYDVDITDEREGSCAVRCTAYVVDDGHASEGAAEFLGRFFELRLQQFFAAVHELLRAVPSSLLRALPDESASAHGRRVLLAGAFDHRTLAGDATPVDAVRWAEVRSRWSDSIAGIEPALQHKLASLVERGADDVVRRVRPGELALAWGVEPRAMLRALLAATRLGLLDLRWELRCRNCRSSASTARSLDSVGRSIHCAECGIDTVVDLASNVEAVFAVASSLRKVSAKSFCGASPAFRPHVAAFFTVAPRSSREVRVSLPMDGVIARATRRQAKSISLAWSGAPSEVTVRLSRDGWRQDDPPSAPGSSAATLVRVVNEGDEPMDVQLEHRADGAAQCAVTIASMPEFAQWFGGEAPAHGAELSVSAASVLLIECVELDPLFEREGDVAASARLEAALNAVASQLEARSTGAVLRRAGAGLTALFDSEVSAEHAFERAAEQSRLRGVSIAGALYTGPCVMVRRDDRCELLGRGLLRARAALAREDRQVLQKIQAS